MQNSLLSGILKSNNPDSSNDLNSGSVCILSERKHLIGSIVSQLNSRGKYDITVCSAPFDDSLNKSVVSGSHYIIIDIGMNCDLDKIETLVRRFLPVTSKVIFVGDSDSIRFATGLYSLGFTYIQIQSQLIQLGKIISENRASNHMYAQVIRIIGCKGGIGTSTISWNVYNTFYKISNLPTLIIQGGSGSSDLDIISGTPIQRDDSVVSVDARRSMKMHSENCCSYSVDEYKGRFNFIITDDTITNEIIDDIDGVFASSDFLFVVFSRENSSIRNAKFIVERFLKNKSKNVRMILILNDSRPRKKNMLTDDEISEFLQMKIEVSIPFYGDDSKLNKDSAIRALISEILGVGGNGGGDRKFFSRFF